MFYPNRTVAYDATRMIADVIVAAPALEINIVSKGRMLTLNEAVAVAAAPSITN